MTMLQELMDRVAARHGVVTHAELLAAELSTHQIDRLRSSGRLVGDGTGVYHVAGAPRTFEARVLRAALDTEGAAWASHHTAARLWGMDVPAPELPIELTRPYGVSAARRGVRLHRSTLILQTHITRLDGIPVTTPARTLFDLARTTTERLLDRAVEQALRDRLCTVGALHRVLSELGGRGRPGTRRMRRVLESRGTDYVPTASELEAVGRAVLATVPDIEWEASVSDDQGYIRRVDALVRAARLVVEFDGERFHGQPSDVARDAATDARLVAAGLIVLRFTWVDLTTRSESVRATVDRIVLGTFDEARRS